MKQRKPGTVPPGRIAILDQGGRIRGHVGPHATTATVARFLGHHNAKLEKNGGRAVWQSYGEDGPKIGQRASESANHRAARGSVKAPRG